MCNASDAPQTPEEHRIYQADFWVLHETATWQEIRAEVEAQTPGTCNVDPEDWVEVMIRVCGYDVFATEPIT